MLRNLSSLACAGLLVVVATARAEETYQWPQWQGPDRNCLTDETGLLKSWPEGGPPRSWLFENAGAGYSGPAIVDGRLYIMGTRDGNCLLLALDADTGEELWATPMGPMLENDWGDGPRSTPTVDGQFVYGMSGRGTLVCVRAADGQEVWRTSMEELGGEKPFWGYAESVLIDGNRLLCTPGGAQGTIAALDKATGRVLWRSTELDDKAQYTSMIRGELNGQPQYVQLLEARVVGLAPDDGRLLWESPWPGRVATIPTPIVHDGHVFVTSGYGAGCKLLKIGPQNEPEIVYENKRMKNHHNGVILLDGYLYGYSDDVGWLCMDFLTGTQQWREKEALSKGAIAYADDRFYCLGEEDGTVVLIDASPEGWKERGRFTLEPQTEIRKDQGKIWTHPVIVGGKLYLRDQDLIYCYDVRE
jgi:outer membrane protein assembly factor BamB